MSIPFTQFVLPRGRQVAVTFDAADEETDVLAHALIERGVRFEIERLRTGEVSLEAVGPDDEQGDPVSLAVELCEDGPPIEAAIAKLVRDATAELAKGDLS